MMDGINQLSEPVGQTLTTDLKIGLHANHPQTDSQCLSGVIQ
jgi:hypothetical protein